MNCTKLLKHLLEHGTWFTSAIELDHDQDGEGLRAVAERAIAREDDLILLLRESKRTHYHCDDSWYCCGACRHPDHALYDHEHLSEIAEGGPCDRKVGVCSCGVGAWNARVDGALQQYEIEQQPEPPREVV